jgi:hypothetical protein
MAKTRIRKIDPNSLPKLEAKNSYDKFDLDFLRKDDDKVFNGEYDVTNVPNKLIGCPTGAEDLKLRDYLVYRPIPKELLQWRTIPNFDKDSLDMENWYKDLIQYCKHGVWVDGEYWNPFMVYWLNVFLFPVYKIDGEGYATESFEPGHPFYCNIDRYIFDILWKCEITRQDFALMGPRGFGKSFIVGNIMDREYRLFPTSWTIVSSTNEETTNEAWSKVHECLNTIEVMHKALKHKRIANSLSLKQSGEIIELPDGTTEERGYLSKLEKIIYGKNAGKTRGKRPTKQLIEEFAAFPPSTQKGNLKGCIRESRGSWRVGSIKKCTVMYTGTGGTIENDEAQDIFLNPRAHDIIPTFDWEEGEEMINMHGELVQRGTGVFIPVHVKWSGSYEATGCPDIAAAEIEIDEQREAARHDPIALQGLKMEYPKTIQEVFERRGVNIFNQDKIAEQRASIQFTPNIPKPEKGFLHWTRNENGRITGVEWDPSPINGDVEILEHPHWTRTDIDLPDDEKEPLKNLYVGGCDSIDQGTMDSSFATNSKKGSELAITIKKRIVDKGYLKYTSNVYVAKYNKRSARVVDDWDNALKIAVYYNAKINIEYTKIGIVGHFRDMGYYHLLKKRPSIALQGGNPNKSTMLVGTQASTHIIDHMDQKVAHYLEEHYRDIWYIEMLEQLQSYDREDRTKSDMVVAMGLTELADEDLMGKVAKPPPKPTDGFEVFGYYTDPTTGYKKRGVIPDSVTRGQQELDSSIKSEANAFNKHGGVRWIEKMPDGSEVYRYAGKDD